MRGRPPPETRLPRDRGHRVELLPTSPTFLNLLLVSGAHERHDLSLAAAHHLRHRGDARGARSRRVHEALPDVPRCSRPTACRSWASCARSRGRRDSLWVKIGGEGFETRVVDGLLEIKARSAMLGYLNAAEPVHRRRLVQDRRPRRGRRRVHAASSGASPRSSTSAAEGRPGRGRGRPARRWTACSTPSCSARRTACSAASSWLGCGVERRGRPAAFRSRLRTELATTPAPLQDPAEGPRHHGRAARRALQAHAALTAGAGCWRRAAVRVDRR